MKYVRTKDGRILDLKKRFGHLPWCKNKEEFEKKFHTLYGLYFYFNKEASQIFFYNCYNNCPESIEVVKESNTIEGLVDGLVVEEKGNPNSWFIMEVYDFKNEVEHLKDWTYHAFIKTKEGLIYVAEMNSEGGLELL